MNIYLKILGIIKEICSEQEECCNCPYLSPCAEHFKNHPCDWPDEE